MDNVKDVVKPSSQGVINVVQRRDAIDLCKIYGSKCTYKGNYLKVKSKENVQHQTKKIKYVPEVDLCQKLGPRFHQLQTLTKTEEIFATVFLLSLDVNKEVL